MCSVVRTRGASAVIGIQTVSFLFFLIILYQEIRSGGFKKNRFLKIFSSLIISQLAMNLSHHTM